MDISEAAKRAYERICRGEKIEREIQQAIDEATAERDAEIERLRHALNHAKTKAVSIQRSDLTPDYEYGRPNRLGKKPPLGECWKTPSELAQNLIAYIDNAMTDKKGGELLRMVKKL